MKEEAEKVGSKEEVESEVGGKRRGLNQRRIEQKGRKQKSRKQRRKKISR